MIDEDGDPLKSAVRERRLRRGLRQVDLASTAEVSLDTLRKAERNGLDAVSPLVRRRIARALGLDLEQLLAAEARP